VSAFLVTVGAVIDRPAEFGHAVSLDRAKVPLLAPPPRSASALARSVKRRRGGCVIKKISRSLRSRRSRGGFPFRSIGTPPRPREQRMLRDIFLIARPPLLAVMRGGESALPGQSSRFVCNDFAAKKCEIRNVSRIQLRPAEKCPNSSKAIYDRPYR